jgi:hypothetical protein
VQAFVVCREIYEARKSRDLVLVAPFSGVTLLRYPAPLQFSVYAHLTAARGRYAMSLHLEDPEGRLVWGWDLPNPVEEANPLLSHRIALYDLVVEFPRPGRYNLLILANGDELAQHCPLARLASSGPAEPGTAPELPHEGKRREGGHETAPLDAGLTASS